MRYVLIGLLIAFASSAQAKYFFMANDAMVTKCLHTDLETEPELRARIESTTSMKCRSMEDSSAIIMECKGVLTNLFVYTETKSSCETMAKNITAMLNG
jgi:hypothetical protein